MELELDDHFRPSLKEKYLAFYNRHKFSLTVEPLVFLASLAFGLNEVLSKRDPNIDITSIFLFQVFRSSLLWQKFCGQEKYNLSEEFCDNPLKHSNATIVWGLTLYVELQIWPFRDQIPTLYTVIYLGNQIYLAYHYDIINASKF